jgi:hypothetical protein
MSTTGWMDEQKVAYPHNELFNHKKEWNSDICSNINGFW